MLFRSDVGYLHNLRKTFLSMDGTFEKKLNKEFTNPLLLTGYPIGSQTDISDPDTFVSLGPKTKTNFLKKYR
mgnify:CR=1 FL=1